MDALQELIDEHKAEMPVALAKTLLDACMEQRNSPPTLYEVCYIEIEAVWCQGRWRGIGDAFEDVQMIDHTKRALVEAVPAKVRSARHGAHMLRTGTIPELWVSAKTPFASYSSPNTICCIHAIVPYVPRPPGERPPTPDSESDDESEESDA